MYPESYIQKSSGVWPGLLSWIAKHCCNIKRHRCDVPGDFVPIWLFRLHTRKMVKTQIKKQPPKFVTLIDRKTWTVLRQQCDCYVQQVVQCSIWFECFVISRKPTKKKNNLNSSSSMMSSCSFSHTYTVWS